MRVAERIDAHDDEQAAERDLAAWRLEIRLHALAELARKPAKPPRWVRISVFVALLLLMTISLVGLRHAMRPKISPNEMAIEIRFIDEAPPEVLPEALPEPQPLPARVVVRTTAARRIKPSAAAAQTVSTVPEPESAPSYRIFNPDGSIIIPPAGVNKGMQASFVPQSTAASPIMHHQRPLKVRPNHFAGNWQAPDGETILGSFVREHLTSDTIQFMTPWGTLVKCRVVAVMGGCSWGPPPVWQPTQTWRPASALDEE